MTSNFRMFPQKNSRVTASHISRTGVVQAQSHRIALIRRALDEPFHPHDHRVLPDILNFAGKHQIRGIDKQPELTVVSRGGAQIGSALEVLVGRRAADHQDQPGDRQGPDDRDESQKFRHLVVRLAGRNSVT